MIFSTAEIPPETITDFQSVKKSDTNETAESILKKCTTPLDLPIFPLFGNQGV